MDLATAQNIVAQGKDVDRSTWNHAQQTALFLLHQGEGRDMMLDNDEALQEAVALYGRELKRQAAQRAELIDWDEIDNPRRGSDDEEELDDFILDDQFVVCTSDGAYWIEAATGPGGPSR